MCCSENWGQPLWTMCSSTSQSAGTCLMSCSLFRRHMSTCDKAPSESTVTLRVRSENGNQTYRVEMWLSETVGHLRSYLDKHRWQNVLIRRCFHVGVEFNHHVVFLCTAEGLRGPVMTSSAPTHNTASEMTTRRFSRVDFQQILLCFYKRGNTQVNKPSSSVMLWVLQFSHL